MMVDQFAKVIIESIQDSMDAASSRLANKMCKRWEDYHFECGSLHAWNEVMAYIKELAAKAERSDDE